MTSTARMYVHGHDAVQDYYSPLRVAGVQCGWGQGGEGTGDVVALTHCHSKLQSPAYGGEGRGREGRGGERRGGEGRGGEGREGRGRGEGRGVEGKRGEGRGGEEGREGEWRGREGRGVEGKRGEGRGGEGRGEEA